MRLKDLGVGVKEYFNTLIYSCCISKEFMSLLEYDFV